MSGHSKFANIKHKKEKNDAAKGKIFTILGREIAVAVKEGGPDPSNNYKLATVIAKAKANNMPNDTIERGIKKAAGDANSVNYVAITYEGYGPNGTAIIVDALTDNKNRTASNVRNAFRKLKESGKAEYATQAIKNTYNKIALHNKQDFDENGAPLDPQLRASYEQARPYVEKMYETAINGVTTFSDSLFGKSSKKNKENFKKAADSITKDINKYAPEAITGGLIGGGVSLLTGAIGGPLLGAAVGAGIAITKKSDAMQNWLFGEVGKDGEREGGVFSKKATKFINKAFPDAKRLGIVGGVAGLLPFGPLGPVGGMILGATAGFVKNSNTVQDLLFGDSKNSLFGDKEEFKKKVDKYAPHAGIGALLGAVTTPFGLGLLPSVALGAAAGLATTNNKFREMVIGIQDDNGEYQGGLRESESYH